MATPVAAALPAAFKAIGDEAKAQGVLNLTTADIDAWSAEINAVEGEEKTALLWKKLDAILADGMLVQLKGLTGAGATANGRCGNVMDRHDAAKGGYPVKLHNFSKAGTVAEMSIYIIHPINLSLVPIGMTPGTAGIPVKDYKGDAA